MFNKKNMKRVKLVLFSVLIMVTVSSFGQQLLKIEPAGASLLQYYQGLNVENLWLKGVHVNWETGEPDNPEATKNVKTHCSSFAAAACKKLNIYLLHPPEHKVTLLANAQYDWLQSNEGYQRGWRSVSTSDFIQIQQLANSGHVEVAVWKSPESNKSGHIALVIPQEIYDSNLTENTILMIQAGGTNSSAVPLKKAFKNHIHSWPDNDIVFYYNISVMN